MAGTLVGNATVLCASPGAALARRKELAMRAGAPSLGVAFTTPRALVADEWAVWGDGRAIVEPHERLALVLSLLSGQSRFAATLGTAQLIAGFVAQHAGADELAPSGELGLLESDAAVLSLVGNYLAALDARNLIEVGCAARELERLSPGRSVVVELGVVLPTQVARLVGQMNRKAAQAQGALGADAGCASPLPAQRTCEGADGSFSLPPLPAGVEPAFLFPAGPTVVTSMLKDEIERCLALSAPDGFAARSVVVCARDPRALFDALVPALVDAGVACALSCSVPFPQTALGRTLEAVRLLRAGDAHWIAAATDFALSAYSGMSRFAAQRLNGELRADRLSTCAGALAALERESPTFSLFMGVFGNEPAQSLAALERAVRALELVPPADRALERAAAGALRDLIDRCASVGAPPASALALTATLGVSLSVVAGPEAAGAPAAAGDAVAAGVPSVVEPVAAGERSAAPPAPSAAPRRAPLVRIVALCDAESLPSSSVDAVIVCDVTDASFPASSSRTSLDALAEKLGLSCELHALDGARRRFAAAMLAAKGRFTCVMPLRDESLEEAYPAFFVDEYVAALRGSHPVVERKGIPLELSAVLLEKAFLAGEEHLASSVGETFSPIARTLELPRAERGRLCNLRLLDRMRVVETKGGVAPVLSPSAIEAYLACPYRWFIERRVGVREIDETFGPREKGAFAHATFERFFEKLAERGADRVHALSLDDADALLDEAFDDVLARQPHERENRLVATTQAERLEVASLRDALRTCLHRQRLLPESYGVVGHEQVISPDEGLNYAGARLAGRVDRIDANDDGTRFAVLDYKGRSVGHAAGFAPDADDEFALPAKVQALVYAQVLRNRFEGMSCAAALYLGYRAKTDDTLAAGSFDPTSYDATGAVKDSSAVDMSFDRFLDMVEEGVRPSVEALVAGDIAPQPATKGSCAFCPVTSCERRRS